MKFDELEKRFSKCVPHIREAGKMAVSMRKAPDFASQIKEDGSPVTNADEAINKYLKTEMSALFPGEVIVGEEDEDKSYPAGSRLVWYIDPIDGTRTYIEGGSHYYVLIGLVVDGVPALGLHYRPETESLLYGWQGKYPQIQDFGNGSISETLKDLSWPENPRLYLKTKNKELRQELGNLPVERARYAPGMVDMVAPLFGFADGFVSYRPTAYWDLAAPAAIMASAGFIGPHHPNGSNGSESGKILFNDGSHKTAFYYSLPPDSPKSFLKKLNQLKKGFVPG